MRHRLSHRVLATVLAILALVLCGCGKKGPLYLPDDAPRNPGQAQSTNP